MKIRANLFSFELWESLRELVGVGRVEGRKKGKEGGQGVEGEEPHCGLGSPPSSSTVFSHSILSKPS